MFTGIIEEIGEIGRIQKGAHSAVLTIKAGKILEGLQPGDSVAVDGVCLTVTALMTDAFQADVMHETMDRTILSGISRGSEVNLERAMQLNGRFGGHIVSGHVDGMGSITDIQRDDNAVWFTIQAAPEVMRYVIKKGSITIDGISLTVAEVTEDTFSVSTIPHTLKMTILKNCKVGDNVNLENDIVGKYVEKLLMPVEKREQKSNLTKAFLMEHGF